MRPAISIDLGAAYTKIGIRREPEGQASLLQHQQLRLDEEHACIPTIAAWRRSDDQWAFGLEAQDLKETDDIAVFRNWKPILFSPPEESLDPESEIGKMFYQYLDGEKGCPIKTLAAKYFHWLLRDMLPKMIGTEKCSDPMLRVSVPNFADGIEYDYEIRDIVRLAGWTSPHVYTAHEPITNLVGTLSRGKNALLGDGSERADIGQTLSGSGIVDYLNAASEGGTAGSFNILSVDVGAYTADLALFQIQRESSINLPPYRCHSEPYGIEMLDNLVKRGLGSEKSALIDGMTSVQREYFRRNIYMENRPWSLNEITIGEGNDLKVVEACIHGMATRISNAIDQFLNKCEAGTIHEVVFTGGGSNIPRLTQRFAERLQSKGVNQFYAPNLPGTCTLSQQVVRGASAIGGASVIFGEE